MEQNKETLWLGIVPKNWQETRIGSVYVLRNVKVSDRDYKPLSVTKQGVLPQLETVAKTNAHDDRKLVKIGDFVINSRSDRRGSCGISNHDGSVSLINTVLSPRDNMNNTYFNWLFHTEAFADEFYKWGHGIVVDLWTTTWQDMKNIDIIVPPLSEQQAIAEFLDNKCGEIDEIAKIIEEQIETLENYKRSLITETVTKGLDKSAKTKDSGIAWIGKIPEHWEIKKLKHITYIIGGNGFNIALQGLESGDFPFCKASDISVAGKYINKAANYVTADMVRIYHYNIIPKGAILFPKIGEAMKKNNRSICMQDSCTDNNCQAVVPFRKDITVYLYYVLTCIDMGWFDNAGTIPCMNNKEFLTSKIPFPPLSEQQAIAEFLDNKCGEIDEIIADKQKQLDTLNAYKQSIIYEYVTGKKEVVNE